MLTKTVNRWLARIDQNGSWLHPKLSELSNHQLILDRDVFINRIAKEIKAGGLIVLAADYDADGICSGTILTECIRACGGRTQIILASRFLGGYGFSSELASKVLALNPSLLVTCDFGSSNHSEIELMNSHGIDCLVLDHHLVPDKKLPSLGFINPHRPECPSEESCKNLCSGGLAFSVASGLVKELGLSKQIDARQWIDLAGVATVCDVMNLSGDNRIITRYALKALSEAKRPGIRALLELTKFTIGSPMTARDIGFKIGPAINSAGRLGSPDIIVDLMLSKSIEEARVIATQVKDIWDKRRLMTDVIADECIKEVEANNYHLSKSIVLGSEIWGHGIVGIVASRIVDKYGKPTAVIGSEGRGSLRGPPGSKLYDALVHSKDTLIKFGGHQSASGCQLNLSCLDSFRQKFEEFFKLNPPSQDTQVIDTTLDIDLTDSLLETADDLLLLEPTGQGNPKPQLRVTGKVKSAKAVKGNHLKLDIVLSNGKSLGCFAIAKGGMTPSLTSGVKVEVLGDLRKNVWMGKTSAEIFADGIEIKS